MKQMQGRASVSSSAKHSTRFRPAIRHPRRKKQAAKLDRSGKQGTITDDPYLVHWMNALLHCIWAFIKHLLQ